MKTKEEILREAMAVKYCGETYFDFLDDEEKPLIYSAMESYRQQSEGVCEWQCETYPNCLPYGVRSSDMKINEYKYCPFCGKPIKRV